MRQKTNQRKIPKVALGLLIAFLVVGFAVNGLATNHTIQNNETDSNITNNKTINDTEDKGESSGTEEEEGQESEQGKFRIPPDVKLRPVEDDVNRRQPGIVELFVNNPTLNDRSVTVESTISVPSGVHLTGEGLAQSGGAGTVVGSYEVPAGTSRTITIKVFPTETGEHSISGRVLYWPTGNKDDFQQFSLTHSFNVESVPETPEGAVPKAEGNGITDIQVSQSFLILLLIGGLVIAVVIYAWRSQSEVTIEE